MCWLRRRNSTPGKHTVPEYGKSVSRLRNNRNGAGTAPASYPVGIMMRTLCILALGAGLAAAQTLTETAISATGGSAAGVAGKSVSDGIDKIFGLLKTQTAHAAEPSQPKSKSKPTAAPEQAGSSQSAAPAGHRRRPVAHPGGCCCRGVRPACRAGFRQSAAPRSRRPGLHQRRCHASGITRERRRPEFPNHDGRGRPPGRGLPLFSAGCHARLVSPGGRNDRQLTNARPLVADLCASSHFPVGSSAPSI